jgi:hypothetical protein
LSPVVGVCEMASSFASSLVAEREEKRVQAREEIGAAFIGAERGITSMGSRGIKGKRRSRLGRAHR